MNIINSYRFAAGGIPTDGLIAEYLFDADASDTSGNAYNGTLNGDAAVSGGLLTLDGTGDYVIIADNNDFSFTDGAGTDEAFSISLWARSTEAIGTLQHLISKQTNSGSFEWSFRLLATGEANISCPTLTFSANINATSSGTFTQNQWHHYVATYSGSESENGLTVYIDGSEDTGTRASSGTYTGMGNGTSDVGIGSRFTSGSDLPFQGDMDNVRIYKNKELTAAEVTALYNEGHD